MGRKISIVSGKGGVGKTTIACGLALALAKNGSSVCLVDLDVGLNNLDVLLNMENKVVYDIGDCLQGKCRLKQALLLDPLNENLYLLPSMRMPAEAMDDRAVKQIVDKLASVFDYVLIDAPAGAGEIFDLSTNVASEAIVVVTPHTASIRDADKVIGILKGKAVSSVSIVVNRIRGDLVARKEMLSHTQIARLLKANLLGVVPESDEINIYSSFKFEKIAKSSSILAFTILAHNLKSDKKVIFDYESKYKGLLGIIRRNLKRSM